MADDNTLKIEVEEVGSSGSGLDGLMNSGNANGGAGGFGNSLMARGGAATEYLSKFAVALQVTRAGLEKLEQAAVNFAAKIEANSPQVQIGQAMADVRKLQTDLYADRLVGKDLRKMIDQQSRQEAAIEKMEANFIKAIMPIVNAWNELKATILENLVPYVEKGAKIADDVYEYLHYKLDYLVALLETWRTDIAKQTADQMAEERRKNNEKNSGAVDGLEKFFSRDDWKKNFENLPFDQRINMIPNVAMPFQVF